MPPSTADYLLEIAVVVQGVTRLREVGRESAVLVGVSRNADLDVRVHAARLDLRRGELELARRVLDELVVVVVPVERRLGALLEVADLEYEGLAGGERARDRRCGLLREGLTRKEVAVVGGADGPALLLELPPPHPPIISIAAVAEIFCRVFIFLKDGQA